MLITHAMGWRSAALVLVSAILFQAPVIGAAEPVTGGAWIQVETEHFTLLSNAGRRTAIQIGDRLEQLWQVMAATFVDAASRPPTWIYVFRDQESIAPFTIGADGRPDSVAGYYIAREPEPSSWSGE